MEEIKIGTVEGKKVVYKDISTEVAKWEQKKAFLEDSLNQVNLILAELKK